MKNYDRIMSRLSFREDFCEETVQKAIATKTTHRKTVRWATVAACLCVCTVLLVGTALAVSPTLRAMLIPNFLVETTEEPALPAESNDELEYDLDGITARYYKLDGASAADMGFGSAYPVTKNGVLSFYSISEAGELQIAQKSRHIQSEITYKGKTWSLDMDLYGGDIPVIHDNEMKYPIDGEYITLSRWEGKLWLPIYVNLSTMEIDDPALHLNFTPDADAAQTFVQGYPGSSTLLIRSELNNDLQRYYLANGETGQVTLLGEGKFDRWFMWNENVYSYDNGTLSLVQENGAELPLFDGQSCCHDVSGFAYRVDGNDLHVLDLRDQGEYILENCADSFVSPVFSHNRAGTKLCVANVELGNGLNNTAIAMVDRVNGRMVTFHRDPAVKEELMGWLDHDRFLIAGTMEGEWYLCVYEMTME